MGMSEMMTRVKSWSESCGILDILEFQAGFCDWCPSVKLWSPGWGLRMSRMREAIMYIYIVWRCSWGKRRPVLDAKPGNWGWDWRWHPGLPTLRDEVIQQPSTADLQPSEAEPQPWAQWCSCWAVSKWKYNFVLWIQTSGRTSAHLHDSIDSANLWWTA